MGGRGGELRKGPSVEANSDTHSARKAITRKEPSLNQTTSWEKPFIPTKKKNQTKTQIKVSSNNFTLPYFQSPPPPSPRPPPPVQPVRRKKHITHQPQKAAAPESPALQTPPCCSSSVSREHTFTSTAGSSKGRIRASRLFTCEKQNGRCRWKGSDLPGCGSNTQWSQKESCMGCCPKSSWTVGEPRNNDAA